MLLRAWPARRKGSLPRTTKTKRRLTQRALNREAKAQQLTAANAGVRLHHTRMIHETREMSPKYVSHQALTSRQVVVRSGAASTLLANRARGFRLTTRQHIFLIMNEPASSKAALMLGRLMWVVLMGYASFETMESVQWATSYTGPLMWCVLRYLFNILFTIEALARKLPRMPRSRLHPLLGAPQPCKPVLIGIGAGTSVQVCPPTSPPSSGTATSMSGSISSR